jgi:HEXXH motif-containing protein
VPADLTIPLPGSRTARDALSGSLGRLARDLVAIPRTAASSPEAQDALDALQAIVRRALATREGAAPVLAALRSPTVGALVRSLRSELRRASTNAEAIVIELVATLAFELAFAGALDAPFRSTRLPPSILSLAWRTAIDLPPDARAVTFARGSMTIERADGAAATLDRDAIARGEDAAGLVSRPYVDVTDSIALALRDNNPRAPFGADDPREPGNPVDLAGHATDEWRAALSGALAIVGEHLPEVRAEIDLTIRMLVPTGFHAETHRSASYRESIGAIYMTLHRDPMTLAEAIIHEHSHNKLHAFFELDRVIENDGAARFRSPLRPDARPLRGVLLAVHAFLPVALLYERMTAAGHPLSRSHYFPERFARIRAINREGAAVVLESAAPTRAGAELLAEIRRWIDHFDALD